MAKDLWMRPLLHLPSTAFRIDRGPCPWQMQPPTSAAWFASVTRIIWAKCEKPDCNLAPQFWIFWIYMLGVVQHMYHLCIQDDLSNIGLKELTWECQCSSVASSYEWGCSRRRSSDRRRKGRQSVNKLGGVRVPSVPSLPLDCHHRLFTWPSRDILKTPAVSIPPLSTSNFLLITL